MKKILKQEIPLYIVVVVLILIAAATAFIFLKFREVVYNYNLNLPQDEKSIGIKQGLQYGSWPELSNTDFFQTVRNGFIAQNANFIEANLSEMKLSVYEKGILVKTVAILTKGKPGSWWETPAGLYKIESKAKTLYSSFGKVYTPWNMPFQGNFIIHGWPYYPDGTPVSSKYSGGCIRLSTEDAKTVFDMVDVGTPVLVYEKDFGKDHFQYQSRGPEISGISYLAADLHDNFVFLSSSSTTVLPIASLTKLVAALVATEYINLEKEIVITRDMLVKTSKPRLYPGEKISAYQLLFPLLNESSNEAAQALAGFLGEKRFISLMNEKAKALGMEHSEFADPAGMKADNISTAEDLFALSKYLYNNRSFILKVTAGKVNNSAYGVPEFSDLENFNEFENDPEFVGGKVGEIPAAKQTILSIFNLPFGDAVRPVVIIVLGSEDRAKDARTMLDYVKANYLKREVSGTEADGN